MCLSNGFHDIWHRHMCVCKQRRGEKKVEVVQRQGIGHWETESEPACRQQWAIKDPWPSVNILTCGLTFFWGAHVSRDLERFVRQNWRITNSTGSWLGKTGQARSVIRRRDVSTWVNWQYASSFGRISPGNDVKKEAWIMKAEQNLRDYSWLEI